MTRVLGGQFVPRKEKAIPKQIAAKNDSALKIGWWAAVTLKPGAAPLRCYVGQIQAIDAQGLRLTLVDWVSGMPASWDLFVPHSSLESALVATDRHDVERFGDAATKWQEQVETAEI
jgi:hypothetical protein